MAGVPVPAACASTRRTMSDGGVPRCSASRKRGLRAELRTPCFSRLMKVRWKPVALPKRVHNWSLTSLQQRLAKTGGRLIKHARYGLPLAESPLRRRLFGAMVRRIAALPLPSG